MRANILTAQAVVIFFGASSFFFSTPASKANANETAGAGLYVRNGILMHGEKPCHAIGANYNTLFGRLLQNKDDESSLRNLALLGKQGIPFVRFLACGYWPGGERLYLDNPSEFFRRMDQVVKCAEDNHIGLIPSLFWRVATVGELFGEPPAAVGDSSSKSSQFVSNYTAAMVSRYKDSPAIWAWEFGNEANNAVDLPRRGERPARGLRSLAPPTDIRLTSAQVRAAYILFANQVRKIDPTRPIDPGTSLPRAAAWHNARGQFWQRDTLNQTFESILYLTPDPMNMLSVHVYDKAVQLFSGSANNVNQVVALLMQFAEKARKPLFIGEFPTRNRAEAEEYLSALQRNRVPLAAFWSFDDPSREQSMSVDFHNDRAFVLDLVKQANRALGEP